MYDVFVSYARRDLRRVEPLVRGLEAAGLSVWWDSRLRTGDEFRAEIREALNNAKAVVVVWSYNSVTSHWVLDEAEEARKRGILFPAMIDLVDLPLGFRQLYTIDLVDWRGEGRHAGLIGLIDRVEQFVLASREGEITAAATEDKGEKGEAGTAEAPPPAEAEAPAGAEPREQPRRRDRPGPPPAGPGTVTTGSRTRGRLVFRATFLSILMTVVFGEIAVLAGISFPIEISLALLAVLALSIGLSRYLTFFADRLSGAASLRLLSSSYVKTILSALLVFFPLFFWGRLDYAFQPPEPLEWGGLSAENKLLFVATPNGELAFGNWEGERLGTLTAPEKLGCCLAAFTGDGKRFVASSRRQWYVWQREQRVAFRGQHPVLGLDLHARILRNSDHRFMWLDEQGTHALTVSNNAIRLLNFPQQGRRYSVVDEMEIKQRISDFYLHKKENGGEIYFASEGILRKIEATKLGIKKTLEINFYELHVDLKNKQINNVAPLANDIIVSFGATYKDRGYEYYIGQITLSDQKPELTKHIRIPYRWNHSYEMYFNDTSNRLIFVDASGDILFVPAEKNNEKGTIRQELLMQDGKQYRFSGDKVRISSNDVIFRISGSPAQVSFSPDMGSDALKWTDIPAKKGGDATNYAFSADAQFLLVTYSLGYADLWERSATGKYDHVTSFLPAVPSAFLDGQVTPDLMRPISRSLHWDRYLDLDPVSGAVPVGQFAFSKENVIGAGWAIVIAFGFSWAVSGIIFLGSLMSRNKEKPSKLARLFFMAPLAGGLIAVVVASGIMLANAALDPAVDPVAFSFLAGGAVAALGAILAGWLLAFALRFLPFSEAGRRGAAALPAALLCAFALLALMEMLPLEGVFAWIAIGFVGAYVLALGRVILVGIVWMLSVLMKWLQGAVPESRAGSVFQGLRTAFGIEVILVSLAVIILALIIMTQIGAFSP